MLPHPKPYKLHWFTEDGDITIQCQVKVKFSIGKYKEEVLLMWFPWRLVIFY